MKRRYPGDQNGPLSGSVIPRQRPHDPRFPSRGGGGPPNVQRAPPPSFAGRGVPPMNMGFQGRGPAQNFQGRGPPQNNPGRGPQFPQGRSLGRGVGRPPMGRGHMMGRGPMPGRPPMVGRGHPGRGPPMPPPNIPPPPPRGNMGYPPHSGMRPPQQQRARGIPPPPIRGHQPHQPTMGLGQTSNRGPQTQFPHQQLQHVPPQNIPGVLPQVGGTPPSQFATNNAAPQSNAASIQPSGVTPSTYNNNNTTFFNVPVASATATVSTAATQGQAIRTHNAHQTGQGTPSKPTIDQIDQAWKEYTAPTGIKYYHNPILKESTYTKPITLTKKDAPTSSQTREKRKWLEYEDAASGRKYYSDGVTTTWEKPADFSAEADKVVPSQDSEPERKKKKSSQKKESPFISKEEAIAAFKGLLLAKGIAPVVKWNEVVKICSPDSRWEACEGGLSVGERRQALAEYQTKRANELRDQERQERVRAKDAFGQLLTDILPSIQGFSAWSSRFSDVRATLAKDGRFHAVAAEETRESLFLDFCEEFRKRDERKKRNKKRETHDAFLSFLREKEEAGTLTFASTWDSFLSTLDENERKDERFDVSPNMSDSDRQVHFADFVIELQAVEDDKRRRIRDARRRAEKAQREAYREALRKLGSERKILPSSRWRTIEELVSMDESFNLVQAQDRDSPRALFEEFVSEWDDVYHRERSFLSRLLQPSHKNETSVKSGTSYDQFTKMLLDKAAYSKEVYGDTRQIINKEEPISSARLYYDELMSRAADSLSRRNSARRLPGEESSEDEGEIIEDGELPEADGENDNPSAKTNDPSSDDGEEGKPDDGLASPQEEESDKEQDLESSLTGNETNGNSPEHSQDAA